MPPAPLGRRVVKYKCITRGEEVQSAPTNKQAPSKLDRSMHSALLKTLLFIYEVINCLNDVCRGTYITAPVFTSIAHYTVVSVVL